MKKRYGDQRTTVKYCMRVFIAYIQQHVLAADEKLQRKREEMCTKI